MAPTLKTAPSIATPAAQAAELLAAGATPIAIIPANLPDDNTPKTPLGSTIAAPAHGAAEPDAPIIPLELNKEQDGAPKTNPSEPVTVPAPRTEADIWCDPLLASVIELMDAHWDTRPKGGTWVEPSEADVNAMIAQRMTDEKVGPMDFAKIGQIAAEITGKIKREKAAAGGDMQVKTDKTYGNALLDMLDKGLTAHVRTLAGFKEKTVKAKTDAKSDGNAKTAEPGSAATTADRKTKRAAQSIAWAKLNGMEDFVRIDKLTTLEGIKGVWHARRLLADGRYEELDFNVADGSYTPTGRIVDGVFADGTLPQIDGKWQVFDTGSANVRMGVLVKNASTAAMFEHGFMIMDYPTVAADINERNKTAE